MGRSRLPLELIPKEKSRKITFQKRAAGLKKKTMEISTLCGVHACMIVYGNKEMGLEPVLYPTDPQRVQDIVRRYKDHIREERGMKTVDLSGFFEEVTKKIHKEIAKRSGNDQSTYPTWDDRLNNIPMDELREYINAWDAKIEAVNSRIEQLKMNQALLELSPPLMNVPSCGISAAGAGPSTQSVYPSQYLSTIDPMQLMPNPMVNPLMSKAMMTHFNSSRPSSFNAQYSVAQPHAYYYDQTVMMENNMFNNFVPSSSRFYQQPIMPSPMMSYMPANQMMLNGPQTNRAHEHYDVNETKQGIRFD